MVTLLGEVGTKPNWRKYSLIRKKAARVIFFADRLTHAKPLMLDMNALNVYQINIYQNLILLYKAHTGTTPSIFFNKFSKISRNYPTSSKNKDKYTILKSTMKFKNFAISSRGPILWNTVLDATLKEIKSSSLFKAKVKEMLLSRYKELCSVENSLKSWLYSVETLK